MRPSKQIMRTFPSVRIASHAGGLPVEVSLIAQLGHGVGDLAYVGVLARQKGHSAFIDELDEPSAKLGSTDFAKGDATALYSFSVGPQGHPFHRHAWHRVFTAISGSGGAQLRFSTASPAEIAQDPQHFFDRLQCVNIPADCLFTVRFGGETWHQFVPLAHNKLHPAFFALSCHTNELGGDLSAELRDRVLANSATIPALTQLLPDSVQDLLQRVPLESRDLPTTRLALDAAPGSVRYILSKAAHCGGGLLRALLAQWRDPVGFMSYDDPRLVVAELDAPPSGSLLLAQLATQPVHHEDTFSLTLRDPGMRGEGASTLLAEVLEGFLDNAPAGVAGLMALRNWLVQPIGLRTSPLGCPVSSLLSKDHGVLFDRRFPVLDQAIDQGDLRAQVILGADDKHLVFRSCVGVEMLEGQQVRITLGTRVHCKNLFGRFYMQVIDTVHRGYIAPTMLRQAVAHVVRRRQIRDEHMMAGVVG
ncbi:MAG: DUF2867 domain-containing protein [Burkholderiales bacterium]|nr:DUF2867 domain-containing protein [Burkholderiales bacterium]